LKQCRRNFAGEKILLKVEVFEGGARRDVRRKRTGEGIETKAESVEVREVGEHAGGKFAGE
jgi:hypothetical protein